MISKRLLVMSSLVLVVGVMPLIASEKGKIESPAKELNHQARHWLYDNCKNPKLLETIGSERTYYRALVKKHLKALQAKRDKIAEIKKKKMIEGGFHVVIASACGAMALHLSNKIKAGYFDGTYNSSGKTDSGKVDSGKVEEVIKISSSEKDKDNAPSNQEGNIKNPLAAELTMASSAFIAVMSGIKGINKLYQAFNYEAVLEQKIARDEKMLALLTQQA